MNADDLQYGSLTPSPEEEEEKKKKKNIKKVLVGGLAALALLGGCSFGLGSCMRDRQPAPMPEETAAVVVDKREIAPTPTEYIMPVAPTPIPTEAIQVETDEEWYGTYEGTATGRRQEQVRGTIDIDEFFKDEELLWVEILPPEYCSLLSYCDEDRSWGLDINFIGCENGVDYTNIRLYLPADLSDAPGLTITDDKITISPTEEYPYELVIEKVDGQLEGRLQTGWMPKEDPPEQWTVDYLTADRSTERLAGPLSCWP